ncbi:hypothetical protein E2C01_046789 [Portunus trituberculatus]|uniref:Uncharacterized protein n=1 Tax=Portunus trituberculatus TaxID=210409 RepID=A0A5B7G5S0_PORTR|nr:hypothetical protein [Portunus trituberculatus]
MTLDHLYKGQSHLQRACAAPPTLTVVVAWLVWVKCALSVSVNGWCSIWHSRVNVKHETRARKDPKRSGRRRTRAIRCSPGDGWRATDRVTDPEISQDLGPGRQAGRPNSPTAPPVAPQTCLKPLFLEKALYHTRLPNDIFTSSAEHEKAAPELFETASVSTRRIQRRGGVWQLLAPSPRWPRPQARRITHTEPGKHSKS